LGIDFIGKTGLVLDILKQEYYFHTPDNRLDFHKREVSTDHLTPGQRAELQEVLDKYPDALIEKLWLTRMIKYHTQLKDSTPVKAVPYRLAPPKMRIFTETVGQRCYRTIYIAVR
jgi:hypothetical protein